MKPAGTGLWSLCVAAIAGAAPLLAAAADAPVAARELSSFRESGKVSSAMWSRREDAFTLVFKVQPFIGMTIPCLRGLDPSFGARTEEEQRRGVVTVSEELQKLIPQNIATYMPVLVVDTGSNSSGSIQSVQRRPKVVQVWLLRADGVQISPTSRSNGLSQEELCRTPRDPRTGLHEDQITYTFPLAEGEQAVAVAVQIDEDFYIEKLQ